ncbi:MAG: outer membrane beta-barrel protein [Bacteroidales bacterium]|nr:outer membrane beta-barrel protein [Bacteroidales bacterium]
MKKTRIIALMCLLAVVCCGLTDADAQSNKKKKEKILENVVEKADELGVGEKIPGWKLIKAKATGRKTLMGLSLGYGNLGLTDFTMPNRLFDASGNPLDKNKFDGGTQWSIRLKIIFYRNKQFSIHTGLGYESNIFKFQDVYFPSPLTASGNLAEEKLVARYVTVPLQFKYKLSKPFSLHAGLIGGVNFNNSHTGEKFLLSADNFDYTARKEFKDFNPFKLDAQAGFTLYRLTFYFKYGILNTFKSDSDFSAHAMSWGISLGI